MANFRIQFNTFKTNGNTYPIAILIIIVFVLHCGIYPIRWSLMIVDRIVTYSWMSRCTFAWTSERGRRSSLCVCIFNHLHLCEESPWPQFIRTWQTQHKQTRLSYATNQFPVSHARCVHACSAGTQHSAGASRPGDHWTLKGIYFAGMHDVHARTCTTTRRISESTAKLELEQATWDSTEAAAESWSWRWLSLSWSPGHGIGSWSCLHCSLQGIPIKT